MAESISKISNELANLENLIKKLENANISINPETLKNISVLEKSVRNITAHITETTGMNLSDSEKMLSALQKSRGQLSNILHDNNLLNSSLDTQINYLTNGNDELKEYANILKKNNVDAKKLNDLLVNSEKFQRANRDRILETNGSLVKQTEEYEKQKVLRADAIAAERKKNDEIRRGEEILNDVNKVLRPIIGQLKRGANMWMKIDDITMSHARSIGVSAKAADEWRKSNMTYVSDLAKNFGVAEDVILSISENYSKITGKAQLLSESQIKGALALKQTAGDSAWNTIADNVSKMGGDITTSASHLSTAFLEATNSGLNAQKTSEAFANNIKLASTYNFRNGVSDIRRMTMMTESMRINMQSLAQATDKFGTIEDAISNSARIQMLGGSMFADFSNPLTVMNESMVDTSSLMDRIVDQFKGKAFIGKDGTVEMSPYDKRILKEYSKIVGIDFGEMMNAAGFDAKASLLRGKMGSNWSNLKEEQQQAIANVAHQNERGEYVVTTSSGEEVNVNAITKDNINDIIQSFDVNKNINKNVETITQYASDTVSLLNRWQGIKTSADAATAKFEEPVMSRVKDTAQAAGQNLTGGTLALLLGAAGAIGGASSIFINRKISPNFKAWLGRKFPKKGVGGAASAASTTATASGTAAQTVSKGGKFLGKAGKALSKVGKFAKSPKGLVTAGLLALGTYAFASNSDSGKGEKAVNSDNTNNLDNNGEVSPIVQEQKRTNEILSAIADNMGVVVKDKQSIPKQANGENNDIVSSTAGQAMLANSVGRYVAKKQFAKTATETVGKKLIQTAVGGGAKGTAAKLAFKTAGKATMLSKAMAGPAGWAALGGDVLQIGGNSVKDRGHRHIGAAMNIGGKALEYGAYGAMLGSVVPLLGNGVGAGVGAAIGTAVGAWQEYSTEIKSASKQAVSNIKNSSKAFLGLDTDKEKIQFNISKNKIRKEHQQIGVNQGEDIMVTAARATISIQNMLAPFLQNKATDKLRKEKDDNKGLFKNIGRGFSELFGFEDGGVVGGNSYSGDKVLAKVNSGEMILNRNDQNILLGHLRSIGMGVGKASQGMLTPITPTVTPLSGVGGLSMKALEKPTLSNVGNNTTNANITLTVNGTLNLRGGNNQQGQLDMKQLLNDSTFRKEIVEMVRKGLKERAYGGRTTNDYNSPNSSAFLGGIV